MARIKDLTYCYGCGVCSVVCPQKIISMKLSEEGFLIPVISPYEKCTECGMCEKVCSFLDTKPSVAADKTEPEGFSGVNRNEQMLMSSSSGGVAIEIAREFLKKDYKVCGVRYNVRECHAEHFVADNIKDYKVSMGSKYLQSYSVEGFCQLHGRNTKYVVFGTPCQIDSLRRYAQLIKREEDFVLVDFFCHGVPSYSLWNSYIKEYKDVTSVSFRDKTYGWHNYTMKINTAHIEVYSPLKKNDRFLAMFLGNKCLGRACYNCKFRTISSGADVRIGDMWGEKYAKDEKGVSAILSMSEKGRDVVARLRTGCKIREESVADVCAGQMKGSIPIPKDRGVVLSALSRGVSLQRICRRYGRSIMLRAMVPEGIKRIIKKLKRK